MSIISLCNNCPDNISQLEIGMFNNSDFQLLNNGNTVLNFLLNDIKIPLNNYSSFEFSVTSSDILSPTQVPLIFGNVSPDDKVKLLIIKPIYESIVDYEQCIQWRPLNTTAWYNCGPIMILSGSEDNPSNVGMTNKIEQIEFQNTTGKTITLKILIGV